jgi:hypothetical protein
VSVRAVPAMSIELVGAVALLAETLWFDVRTE